LAVQPEPLKETLKQDVNKAFDWSSQTKVYSKNWNGISVLVLCVFLCRMPSFAALGGDVSSVQADQAHIKASLRSTQTEKYTIHELQSPTGAVVREYASLSGKVFAVAWHSPALPDLKQLLGSHFEEFQQAAQAQNREGVHGPMTVQLPGLVVELGGHMRSFSGRAYLPGEVPSNVRPEEIR
jgi:hypothetical protein